MQYNKAVRVKGTREGEEEGERERYGKSFKISDNHREELTQLESEMHRVLVILIQKDKQERMKKNSNER